MSTQARDRIYQRYERGGLQGMDDGDALELLLRAVHPYRNLDDLVHKLLVRFGTLRGVLDASKRELQAVSGLKPEAVTVLHMVRDLSERLLEDEVREQPAVLSDTECVRNWLRVAIGNQDRENFVVMLLDAGNRLIEHRVLFRGTVNETAVYPREVIRAALQANATGMILAHNHPGGTKQPSRQDIALTRRIASLAETFGIRLHDHLVVTRQGCVSIRDRAAHAFTS